MQTLTRNGGTTRTMRRVAVVGAGTMGSRIAAHFANCGLDVLLLDRAMPEAPDKDQLAREGIARALEQKPAAFFSAAEAARVTPGNLDDDLERLAECDWVLEAVSEDLAIKRQIWQRIDACRRAGTIASTNTSGLRLQEIVAGRSDDLRQCFLGTHFFNPPRYLHLLEVIPGEHTRPELVAFVTSFAEATLGKGVVVARDTPNFIANRIGAFFTGAIWRAMGQFGLTIDEVDALTGPLIGVPKSATFRLVDLVGVDVWHSVLANVYRAGDDEWRAWFAAPGFLEELRRRGLLGDKTGSGFYRRYKGGIQVLDLESFTYREPGPAAFPHIDWLRRIPDVRERVSRLLEENERAGGFVWQVLEETFRYAAAMTGVICDRVVDIDRAMRWGFGHQLGPFELWDGLGVRKTVERIAAEGKPVPELAKHVLAHGSSFYGQSAANGAPHTTYFDAVAGAYRALEQRPRVISLRSVKRVGGTVQGNASASLIDLGDGVLCLEFHSKMNAVGSDTLTMLERGVALLDGRFAALVIANEGDVFSAGANLALLLGLARDKKFGEIEGFIAHFQRAMKQLKCAPRPVVAAGFSRALGGGCEVLLQSYRVQASAELLTGLVELGVGLIPAAGGCKEAVLRCGDPVAGFQLIASARVSASAVEARQMGLLREADRISINPERLIGDAKEFALELTQGFERVALKAAIKTGGAAAYERLQQEISGSRKAGRFTEHDAVIAEKLARVLTGGGPDSKSDTTSEERLYELEREHFLSLCGMERTQERIQYMLENGKPLRN